MLHKFCHPVAVFCNMFCIKFKNGQIFPATFRCCIMLYSFGLVHATLLHKGMRTRSTACAPGAWGSLTSTCSSKMLKLLRAFGQPVQHMSEHLAKRLQDVAFRRCQRLDRPLNHESSWVYVTCSVTMGLPIHFCLRYSTIFFARTFFFFCVTSFELLMFVFFFALRFLICRWFDFFLCVFFFHLSWNFHSFHRH